MGKAKAPVDELDRRQRMESAEVAGHAERLIQALRWPVDAQTVAEMHALSTDPVVYGVELGTVLGKIQRDSEMWGHLQPLADLYRACGADLEVAEQQKAWRAAQNW
jgi:hypothetical protein